MKAVCLSTDGRYALSGSDDKSLKLWDVSNGKCLRTFQGHRYEIHSTCRARTDATLSREVVTRHSSCGMSRAASACARSKDTQIE